MSTAFGAQALRLSGHAARLLGWRPDEFWHATPAELAAALGEPVGDPALSPRIGRADLDRMMKDDDNGRRG
jgi:hypothetical protein